VQGNDGVGGQEGEDGVEDGVGEGGEGVAGYFGEVDWGLEVHGGRLVVIVAEKETWDDVVEDMILEGGDEEGGWIVYCYGASLVSLMRPQKRRGRVAYLFSRYTRPIVELEDGTPTCLPFEIKPWIASNGHCVTIFKTEAILPGAETEKNVVKGFLVDLIAARVAPIPPFLPLVVPISHG